MVNLTYKMAVIWITAAAFTIFQLFLELLTNTMADGLMASFHINHCTLGLLSSTFFYTFLAMQIPVGIILDKYKINRILAFACGGCGIGCLAFSYAENFSSACIARFIMGAFSAFGFLGLLKVTSILFSTRLFSCMLGFSQFLGMLITAFGEQITNLYISSYGWRAVLTAAGCIALAIAATLLVSLKHVNNYEKKLHSRHETSKQIIDTLFNKQYLCTAIFGFGMFSLVSTFTALWGLTYLVKVHGLTHSEATFGISLNFASLAVGCAVFGIISSYYRCSVMLMQLGALLSLLLMTAMLIIPKMTSNNVFLLLFFIGLFNSVFFLSFDVVKQTINQHYNGIAIAICNIFVMSGTIILQPVIGFIMDSHSNLLVHNTGFSMYTISMFPLLLMLIVSFLSSIFIKQPKSSQSNSSYKDYTTLISHPITE